jgi:hypothetical protein
LENFKVLRQNALLEAQPLQAPGSPDAISHFDRLLVVAGEEHEIALVRKPVDSRDHRSQYEQGYDDKCDQNLHAKIVFLT